jgi:hypothetical protein
MMLSGICDDKLRPQILVGTTANSPFKGRMEINALLMENTTLKYVKDKVIAPNILDGSVLLVVVSATCVKLVLNYDSPQCKQYMYM